MNVDFTTQEKEIERLLADNKYLENEIKTLQDLLERSRQEAAGWKRLYEQLNGTIRRIREAIDLRLP